MHKQSLTALERELINRFLSLDKADGIIESITEQAYRSCKSDLKEALKREDDLTDEMIQWRRLALAWRRRDRCIGTKEDFGLTEDGLNLDDHIKLVEGGE